MDGACLRRTRIVVDLDKACAYELTPGPAGKLVLTCTPSRRDSEAHDSGCRLQAHGLACEVMRRPQPGCGDQAAKPLRTHRHDFVFVEPSYSGQEDAKQTPAPAEEPTVRAQEAAARFSDKTAAELVESAPTQPRHRIQLLPFSPPSTWRPSRRLRLDSRARATGPKYTGEPISVNLKDVDLKDFFRLIHEISGLNVVLDPNVHGTLTVVLDDVPWDQALDIVLKNNDLARELEGNVLRIATVETLKHEADSRRAQIESESLAVEKVSVTRFLSYAKAKDVIVTVKKFFSQRGDVVADDRTNAVIINDIPKTIPTIDRLLHAARSQDAGS